MGHNDVTGVILAGGRARRMGGIDKGLLEVVGRPLVERTIAILRPQVGRLIISANRNQDRYAEYGYPVVIDSVGDYWGPLAGIVSVMRAAITEFIVTVPCDTPGLPGDLVDKLLAARESGKAEVCAAWDGKRVHPVIALIPRALAPALADYLNAGGRKAEDWLRSRKLALADFSHRPGIFININTTDERRRFEAGEERGV